MTNNRMSYLEVRETSNRIYESIKSQLLPVLFKIDFRGEKGLFKLTDEYTAFAEENEVLIQDGLEYLVVENKTIKDEISGVDIQLIELKYPAN